MISKNLPIIKKSLPILIDIIIPFAIVFFAALLILSVYRLIRNLMNSGYSSKANLVLIALWLGFLFFLTGWSSTSSSCASCHVMRSEGEIWRSSLHKGVDCYLCHRDSGLIAKVYRKVTEFRMLTVTATGNYLKPVRSHVPDRRCIKCHSDVLEELKISGGIKVRHSDFAVKSWKCTECHIQVAHGAAVPLQNPPIMTRCVTCHNGKKASAKCSKCHVDEDIKKKVYKWDPWQRAHGQNWEKGHGIVDSTVCVVCHKPSYCAKCHIQMPHPENFKELHGKETLKPSADCLQCHSQSACNSCHKVELPHPASFRKNHSAELKKTGLSECRRCHTENSCYQCHSNHELHPKTGSI